MIQNMCRALSHSIRYPEGEGLRNSHFPILASWVSPDAIVQFVEEREKESIGLAVIGKKNTRYSIELDNILSQEITRLILQTHNYTIVC